MTDLKARLLSARPVAGTAQDAPLRLGIPPRPLFQGLDVLGAKKRGQSIRSWIRIDTSGNSQVLEVDKLKIMRRCDLPARDLRLLDPLFVYPSTILGREKAIVVNLEQIRCIITADEVLLLNSLDSHALDYVTELQRRLAGRNEVNGADFRWRPKRRYVLNYPPDQAECSQLRDVQDVDMFSSLTAEYLPFEFRALEVALEAACTFLDAQATELEVEAYPVLDELTSKVSTPILERARRLKSRLVALTRRVQKVRDEIEQLMDDDGDMAEMYLTDKKERMEAAFQRDQALFSYTSLGTGGSISAPVSPVHSPTESHKLEKISSLAKSRYSSTRTSEDDNDHIEELEMLLEAYFVVIDGTLNKLVSLKEYIDDTEDFINIQLDNVRNQLIQFELLLTTATFVVAIYGVVAGVFGMNISIDMFNEPWTFKWVIIVTGL
eukprot:c27670_g1_i2 orf=445-1752(+)